MGKKLYHYLGLSCNSPTKQFYRVRVIETTLGRGRARVGYSFYEDYLARGSASTVHSLTTPRRRCILRANDTCQNRRTLP